MGFPEANYNDDASDFLYDYRKKVVDPRMEEYQHVVSEFSERYDRSYQMINPFYAEAYRDQSFYLGNQWSPQEIEYLNNQRRESLTYNMCMKMINLIEGIQRQNRLSTVMSPREDGADYTAEVATDCIQYVNERGGFYEMQSTGFKNAMVTGISWLSTYMDYREDPINGIPNFNLDHWNDTIWDPFFYRKDLKDCNFFSRRKYVSRTEAISLLPDKEDEIRKLPYGTRDNKFTYIPYVRQGALNKLMNYTEYWSKRWTTKEVLVNMETGETAEWNGSRDRLMLLRTVMPQVEVIRKPVQEVDLAIIIENQLMYYGRDPNGIADYPCTPIFAIYEPSYDLYQWKMQSLIRLIRDPQLELNKRRSKMVDILDTQMYPGYMAKVGAVTNIDSLYRSGQGPVIFLRPDADMADVQKLQPSDIPPGHFGMMDAFEKDIPNILGINPEMLGMPEQDKIETAAILAKMRVNAGLVSLRRLFDGLSESQKIIGEKVFKMIQMNWTPEKVKLVTKKDVPPDFFSMSFSNYELVIEEGVLTDTQRQSQFTGLLALKTLGVDVPDGLIIQNSNLHDKRQLNDILDAKAKQEEESTQRQMQLEQEQLQVLTDGIESKAQSDQALAMERLNKIHLDQALSKERQAKAEEDRTAGTLNMIKAIKEIQSIDTQDLMRKVQLLQTMSGIEIMQEKNIEQEQAPGINTPTMQENVEV